MRQSLAFRGRILYNGIMYDLIELLASFLAVVVVLTLHEFAHAFVAYKCGDPTPKYTGRLSLNPLRHFDLVGLICFTLVGFGWAKPVQVNPGNFKNYRLGMGLTACAGVLANFLSAFFGEKRPPGTTISSHLRLFFCQTCYTAHPGKARFSLFCSA